MYRTVPERYFVQESTLDPGRVDSRPETRTFTEQSQKYTYFRSRLPRVTSRLGVGLTALTAIFSGFFKKGKKATTARFSLLTVQNGHIDLKTYKIKCGSVH